ncbi:MAG TPA: SOS response-associated peptidase [Acidimicrobiales bacterium]|nr:SOS response-associated peptidase [Acidimicrobiales bacterium]
MCGRFVSTATPSQLADYLRADEVRTETLDASWNVAPTDAVYAVAERRAGEDDERRRLLGSYRWGLVPFWAKDAKVGARMINARAETLASKFRHTFERRRCLVPADGFYEWEKLEDGRKQPWFIHRADGAPMVFAGLWEVWKPEGAAEQDEPLRTCSIITTSANQLLARIHDRMPAVISPHDWDLWLDRSITDPSALRHLLAPADPRQFDMFEVSTAVNSVRNNSGELVSPINPR